MKRQGPTSHSQASHGLRDHGALIVQDGHTFNCLAPARRGRSCSAHLSALRGSCDDPQRTQAGAKAARASSFGIRLFGRSLVIAVGALVLSFTFAFLPCSHAHALCEGVELENGVGRLVVKCSNWEKSSTQLLEVIEPLASINI